MIWLLVSVAFAIEPPARPVETDRVDGECAATFAVGPGDTVDCAALLVPLSVGADLLSSEIYAGELADLFRITTAEMQTEIDMCQFKLDYQSAALDRLNEKAPIIERPTTIAGAGFAAGILVMISTGWVIKAIHE